MSSDELDQREKFLINFIAAFWKFRISFSFAFFLFFSFYLYDSICKVKTVLIV